MARSEQEIKDDIQTVRDAIDEMLNTSADSVGLKQSIDLGGKVLQGLRATLPQLREWLKELQNELAAIQSDETKRRPLAVVHRYSRSY